MPEEIHLNDLEEAAMERAEEKRRMETKKNTEASSEFGFCGSPEDHKQRSADREARMKNKPQPAGGSPLAEDPESESNGEGRAGDKKLVETYRRLARDAEQAGDRASARIYRRQARDITG